MRGGRRPEAAKGGREAGGGDYERCRPGQLPYGSATTSDVHAAAREEAARLAAPAGEISLRGAQRRKGGKGDRRGEEKARTGETADGVMTLPSGHSTRKPHSI